MYNITWQLFDNHTLSALLKVQPLSEDLNFASDNEEKGYQKVLGCYVRRKHRGSTLYVPGRHRSEKEAVSNCRGHQLFFTPPKSIHLTLLTSPELCRFCFFQHVESLKRDFKLETSTSWYRFRSCLLCQKVGARKSISVELNETNFNHISTVFWRSWILKRNINFNAINHKKYLDFCCMFFFLGSRPHKSVFCNQRSLGFQVNKELGLNLSGMM